MNERTVQCGGLSRNTPTCGVRGGFTLIELLVVLVVLAVLAATLLPALAKTKPNTSAAQCLNNLRQLTTAWKMYSHDYNETLLAAQNLQNGVQGRINWMTGNLDFNNSNPSNWDTNQDIVKSPMWPYTGRNADLFKCPADRSSITTSGTIRPRVRSYSMSQVFGTGEWLDRVFNFGQTVWRLYSKSTDIVIPPQTFVFADEHPGSMNDGSLAIACTGAQPGDPPGAAQMIDIPASSHNGGGVIAFADGRVEFHKWLGTAIKPPFQNNLFIPLNIPAGDSWQDIQWLAANTTVRR